MLQEFESLVVLMSLEGDVTVYPTAGFDGTEDTDEGLIAFHRFPRKINSTGKFFSSALQIYSDDPSTRYVDVNGIVAWEQDHEGLSNGIYRLSFTHVNQDDKKSGWQLVTDEGFQSENT